MNIQSKCCKAEVRAECADEGTCVYVCKKCEKPTDFEGKNQQKWCEGCGHSLPIGDCRCGSSCSCHHPQKEGTWEDSFDKKFHVDPRAKSDWLIQALEEENEAIKDFIRTLLAKERERILGLVEGMRIASIDYHTGDGRARLEGFNQALEDVAHKIKEG